jgi:hypothetical protein
MIKPLGVLIIFLGAAFIALGFSKNDKMNILVGIGLVVFGLLKVWSADRGRTKRRSK